MIYQEHIFEKNLSLLQDITRQLYASKVYDGRNISFWMGAVKEKQKMPVQISKAVENGLVSAHEAVSIFSLFATTKQPLKYIREHVKNAGGGLNPEHWEEGLFLIFAPKNNAPLLLLNFKDCKRATKIENAPKIISFLSKHNTLDLSKPSDIYIFKPEASSPLHYNVAAPNLDLAAKRLNIILSGKPKKWKNPSVSLLLPHKIPSKNSKDFSQILCPHTRYEDTRPVKREKHV